MHQCVFVIDFLSYQFDSKLPQGILFYLQGSVGKPHYSTHQVGVDWSTKIITTYAVLKWLKMHVFTVP